MDSVEHFENHYNYTPLQYAVSNGDSDMMDVLISKFGAKVNTKNPDALTALHVGAISNKAKAIETLMFTYKADIGAIDNLGRTVLDLAVSSKSLIR